MKAPHKKQGKDLQVGDVVLTNKGPRKITEIWPGLWTPVRVLALKDESPLVVGIEEAVPIEESPS